MKATKKHKGEKRAKKGKAEAREAPVPRLSIEAEAEAIKEFGTAFEVYGAPVHWVCPPTRETTPRPATNVRCVVALDHFSVTGNVPGFASVAELREAAGHVRTIIGTGDAATKYPHADDVLTAAEARFALMDGKPVTVRQLSLLAGVTPRAVRAAIEDGKLRSVRLGGDHAVRAGDAATWLTKRGAVGFAKAERSAAE